MGAITQFQGLNFMLIDDLSIINAGNL